MALSDFGEFPRKTHKIQAGVRYQAFLDRAVNGRDKHQGVVGLPIIAKWIVQKQNARVMVKRARQAIEAKPLCKRA
jgi:hypothetical protein